MLVVTQHVHPIRRDKVTGHFDTENRTCVTTVSKGGRKLGSVVS